MDPSHIIIQLSVLDESGTKIEDILEYFHLCFFLSKFNPPKKQLKQIKYLFV